MRWLIVALLMLLTACSTPSAGSDTTRSAVATAYPLAWLVEAVAPDFEVTSLSARGQDPHDLELTPQQRAAVEQSDVAVYLGDIDFQPQVEAAVESASGNVVSAADAIGRDNLLPFDAHEGEQAAGIDPHFWFDAGLMAPLAKAVGEAAGRADPANAEQYTDNAERVSQELQQLADDVAALLADCRHDEVIVSHEAYQYLLAPHGLTQHGISGAGGHSEASPQDIARLAAEIRDEGLPAVLSEPVEGRTDAEAVASEAGVEVIDIYSLDIVDEAQAEKGYPELLREQARAVARAAECNS